MTIAILCVYLGSGFWPICSFTLHCDCLTRCKSVCVCESQLVELGACNTRVVGLIPMGDQYGKMYTLTTVDLDKNIY